MKVTNRAFAFPSAPNFRAKVTNQVLIARVEQIIV